MEVHARVRQAARKPSPQGGGIKKNNWGDYVTSFDHNLTFNSQTIQNAMNDIYPGIAFGDTGGKLTFMSSLPNPSGRGRIQISDDAAKGVISDLKAMKETTTKAFTAEPGGTWSFESKCGYGQILDVTDYDYNGVKRYEVNSWGPNVDSGYTKNYYFDLNAAKRGCRDEIIRLYGEQKKKK